MTVVTAKPDTTYDTKTNCLIKHFPISVKAITIGMLTECQ